MKFLHDYELISKITPSMGNIHILFMAFFSTMLSLQGIFTFVWMIYAWEYPTRIEENKSPEKFARPEVGFTALIPARHEKEVIDQTIQTVAAINYPEDKKEIIIICRYDDEETITKVKKILDKLHKDNIQLVTFYDDPINKPHGLNIGLQLATKDFVTVFDAEDEPHPNIYHVVNSVILRDHADVVQSGVQLMNYKTNWFSALNVLEYFAWFKSGLHFFATYGLVPLAGNTVFIKRKLLDQINGWDEHCLTEDADLGIRLTKAGAKIRVVYDEQHVTQEETPSSTLSFIQQRTRWNQGFLQILLKGDWLKLPKLSQRVLAFYILSAPELTALLFFYIPFSIVMILFLRLPVILAMFSTLPMYILLLQLIVLNILFYEFSKSYKFNYSVWATIHICVTYYFFQIVLALSAARGFVHLITANNIWEKTTHFNAHRVPIGLQTAP